MTELHCEISFQSFFSPPSLLLTPLPPRAVFLFVKDLRDDDAFKLSCFWAKDRKGLKRFGPADMCVLGLDKLPRSPDFINLHTWEVPPRIWEDMRVFHEIFGLGADPPDMPRFLDLPTASVERDGACLLKLSHSSNKFCYWSLGDADRRVTPRRLRSNQAE